MIIIISNSLKAFLICSKIKKSEYFCFLNLIKKPKLTVEEKDSYDNTLSKIIETREKLLKKDSICKDIELLFSKYYFNDSKVSYS